MGPVLRTAEAVRGYLGVEQAPRVRSIKVSQHCHAAGDLGPRLPQWEAARAPLQRISADAPEHSPPTRSLDCLDLTPVVGGEIDTYVPHDRLCPS